MSMDFLWHRVSEKEKTEIREQAKEIMNSFEKELKKVESQKIELGVMRKEQLRDETQTQNDPDFRKRFLENAPHRDGDSIKAEKGSWKK
jgi:Asp-tRNA(Asn)/Glu-tRNA(Gln) amidotransferase C subunit